MAHYVPSKYLIQAAPPDMAEGAVNRWQFGVYEILDKRNGPVDPPIVHAMYVGTVEIAPDQIGDPNDDVFSARLEDAVVKQWKKERGY